MDADEIEQERGIDKTHPLFTNHHHLLSKGQIEFIMRKLYGEPKDKVDWMWLDTLVELAHRSMPQLIVDEKRHAKYHRRYEHMGIMPNAEPKLLNPYREDKRISLEEKIRVLAQAIESLGANVGSYGDMLRWTKTDIAKQVREIADGC